MYNIVAAECGDSGTPLTIEEQNFILQYCITNGITDIADVDIDKILAMKKREETLAKNKSEPWLGKDGYWRAYVYDESKSKGRRLIKKKNKKDLEDEIIKAVEQNEKVTIGDLFEEYLQRKIQNDGIKKATVTRYRNVFRRHYIETGWDKKDIRRIDKYQYSDFLEDEIGRCSLDSKALSSLKLVTTGILKRALKDRYIDFSASVVYDLMDTRPHKTHKKDIDQVLSSEEFNAFIDYIKENQTVVNLSLLFMLGTGLRVGEMATLRFADFRSNNLVKVHTTESYYKNDSGEWVYEVSEEPKTEAGYRIAQIPKAFQWIPKKLRILNPFSEYVCTDKHGNRMRSQVLKQKMYQICKTLPEFDGKKSSHKLRKTFATLLLDNNCDKNLIKSLMGHVDISVTENYYHFDRKTTQQKQEMLDNILEFRRVANE